MGTGMGIPHNNRKPGPDKSFFRKYGMADPVVANIKKIFDLMALGPLP